MCLRNDSFAIHLVVLIYVLSSLMSYEVADIDSDALHLPSLDAPPRSIPLQVQHSYLPYYPRCPNAEHSHLRRTFN